MVNVLALVLLALPALASSQVISVNPWKDLYQRILQQGSKAPVFNNGYVCCNQPPTPPSPRKRSWGFRAPSMSKRGDEYTLLKRFYEDFGGQRKPEDMQSDQPAADDSALPSDSLASMDLAARPSPSELNLLRRLLEDIESRSLFEDLARGRAGGDSSALYDDYPHKRGTFVRRAEAPGSVGGANFRMSMA